jgi:AcrR family transcriptional regulator
MPRAFSAEERETIRRQLREQGEKLFEAYGLRKTTVEDITKAVGISKGSFYLFYPSKEELLLEILEQIESDLRESILEYATRPHENARESVSAILKSFLLTWDASPLLRKLGKPDYDYLARKLPAERVQAHIDKDKEFIDNFMTKFERDGISVQMPARVVSNLIKSLFFISIHRYDLGEDDYLECMEILVDLVAGYLTDGAT